MAQQNTDADEAQTENDPELAAATEAEAVQSLQVHLGRDAMREFGREHGSRASGTKQEMAESMMQEAREQALGVLAEEGVELLDDLAEGDKADQDAVEAVAEQDDLGEGEDEQAGEDDSGRQRTPVGEMLRQHPEDYHRDSSLGFSEKQVELLAWAMHHAGDADEQVAEAQECSARYVNSVCHRWPASDEGIEAIEDAGHEVPDYYQETDAPEGED